MLQPNVLFSILEARGWLEGPPRTRSFSGFTTAGGGGGGGPVAVHDLYPWILFGAVSGFDERGACSSFTGLKLFCSLAYN